MFGFYTAFVVNVIKCRSKYKKYSKRILTSKTGKMRQIPGRGQYWQRTLSLWDVFTQNHWALPHFACFSISIKTLILCILKPTDFSKFYEERFGVNSLDRPPKQACRWNFQTCPEDLRLLFAADICDTFGLKWKEEEPILCLDSISTIAILGF